MCQAACTHAENTVTVNGEDAKSIFAAYRNTRIDINLGYLSDKNQQNVRF
jgi:hypothetical protein